MRSERGGSGCQPARLHRGVDSWLARCLRLGSESKENKAGAAAWFVAANLQRPFGEEGELARQARQEFARNAISAVFIRSSCSTVWSRTAVVVLILKRAVEGVKPQITTDGHGFTGAFALALLLPIGEPRQWYFHLCPSVFICGLVPSTAPFRFIGANVRCLSSSPALPGQGQL